MSGVPQNDRGFSFTEVLITIAFMVILLSVALPSFGSLRDSDRAGKILEIAETLGRACQRHHHDTGRLAIEFTAARGGHSYTQPSFHHLSMKQETGGWRGPYLDHPLALDDSPYRGAIYLQNHLEASPADGFDLEGKGQSLQKGPGQFVVFYGVPERIARSIDQTLDGELVLEDAESWVRTGRVEWTPSAGGALAIWLMGAE